jgi:hypothetical protein
MFGYELDNPEFKCRPGQKFSPFSKKTDLPETHSASYSVGGEFFLGGKAAGV